MDFSELILKRQSDRKYSPEPVAKDDIIKCLEAARLAPSLRKVHAVPCKAFEGYELPAAPWLQFFRTAYPAKVRNEICICGIGLFHSDIGLSVIGSGLWVHTEDIRPVGHENLAGRQEV